MHPANWDAGLLMSPHDTATSVLLARGAVRVDRMIEQGLIDETLTSESLSHTFGLPLTLERRPTPNGNRYLAWPA